MNDKMIPNGLHYLRHMTKAAAEHCYAKGLEFDPALADSNLAGDLMMLTVYAAGADGMITLGELENINNAMGELGYEVKVEDLPDIQNYVNATPFAVPKSLQVLVADALLYVEEFADMGGVMQQAMKNNVMIQLGSAIYSYTNIMCFVAVESGLSLREKQVTLSCLKKCFDYVVEHMGEEFRVFCHYQDVVEREYDHKA